MSVAGGAFPDRGQERELAIASDHLDVGSRPSDGTRRDGQPRAKRFLLAFGFDRADRSVRDRASREPVRLLAHHESARPGCGLQPRGGVDDVAHGQRFSGRRTRGDRDHRLAAVHRGARFEFQSCNRVEDREARAHGALCIVTMRHRSTEHRHHGVADELLHGPAKMVDPLLGGALIGAQRVPHILGIGAVRPAREVDQVDEEHGDELAFLFYRLRVERRAAGETEAGPFRVLLPAASAAHYRSLSSRRKLIMSPSRRGEGSGGGSSRRWSL